MDLVMRSCFLFLLVVGPAVGFSTTSSCSNTLPQQGRRGISLVLTAVTDDPTVVIVNGDTTAVTTETAPEIERKRLTIQIDNDDDDDDIAMFDVISGRAAVCLFESEMRRDAKDNKDSNVTPSSATNWINDPTAFALKSAFNRIKLKVQYSMTYSDYATSRINGSELAFVDGRFRRLLRILRNSFLSSSNLSI
jgi:hypothetical protein